MKAIPAYEIPDGRIFKNKHQAILCEIEKILGVDLGMNASAIIAENKEKLIELLKEY